MHRRGVGRASGGSPGLRASVRLGLVAGALSAVWILGPPAAYSQVLLRHKHIHLHKYHHKNPVSQTGAPQGSSAGGGSANLAGSGSSTPPGPSTPPNTSSPPVLTTTSTPPVIPNHPPGNHPTGTSNSSAGGGSDLSLVGTDLGDGSPGFSNEGGVTVSDSVALGRDAPTPVPEPASLAAFGTALALFLGFGAARRRQG